MTKNKWIDLGMKYGGFMAQDEIFLENRLASLTEESEKRLLITPPASVLNAYFAELYQKKSPKEATDYFFNLSRDLEIFESQPNFKLEGTPGHESFRFIRLNLSGQSFGYCYRNADEEALVFSEFPRAITPELLFEISQIFPHYVLHEEDNQILMQSVKFDGDFVFVRDASSLTEVYENDNFIRVSGYNIEDLQAVVEEIGYIKPPLLQYGQQRFNFYISKAF